MSKFTKEHIGERVISKKHGYGTITEVWSETPFPIEVKFDNMDRFCLYTSEGYYNHDFKFDIRNIYIEQEFLEMEERHKREKIELCDKVERRNVEYYLDW